MSLAAGRSYLAIPGPSVLPDRVLAAMMRPAPNIYTGELVALTESLVPDLRAVARMQGSVAIYIANGHGAWEAALSNTVAPGDRVLVLSTGHFARGWGAMARQMGAAVEVLDFGRHAPVEPGRLEERLRADRGHAIGHVLAVQTDTGSGVRNDIAAIRAAMDAAGHPALLQVDCIACLACDRFEMDAWGVDVTVAASQKGLMSPPGLGMVWFNRRAETARARLERVSPYWDWRQRAAPDLFYQYFFGTAPTHHLFALRTALDILLHEEGLEAAWARHETLARAVWAAFEAWHAPGGVTINVPDRGARSHAVTALKCPPPLGTRLRDWVETHAGVTLGIGLGLVPPGSPEWHGHFRIGHMGHLNAHMVLGALGAVEAGLVALDIPHGQGGLAAAARVCAGR